MTIEYLHTYPFAELDECPHVIYDLSITDINERRSKAKHLDNVIQVAAYLGVTIKKVFANRTLGKKIEGLNGKLYAVRVA